MNLGSTERPEEASFDLTPLIDVVLLLIIFFMLSSQFSRSEQIYLELPKERGGETTTAPGKATFFIDINARGEYAVLGNYVSLEDVPRLLGAEAGSIAALEHLDVVVRADRNGSAAALNRLAEALARAGVRDFKLATTPEGAPPGAGRGPSGSGGTPL